jgi:hypothetical protein
MLRTTFLSYGVHLLLPVSTISGQSCQPCGVMGRGFVDAANSMPGDLQNRDGH